MENFDYPTYILVIMAIYGFAYFYKISKITDSIENPKKRFYPGFIVTFNVIEEYEKGVLISSSNIITELFVSNDDLYLSYGGKRYHLPYDEYESSRITMEDGSDYSYFNANTKFKGVDYTFALDNVSYARFELFDSKQNMLIFIY